MLLNLFTIATQKNLETWNATFAAHHSVDTDLFFFLVFTSLTTDSLTAVAHV